MHVPHRPPEQDFDRFACLRDAPGAWTWLMFILAFFTFGLVIHGLTSSLNGWRSKTET